VHNEFDKEQQEAPGTARRTDQRLDIPNHLSEMSGESQIEFAEWLASQCMGITKSKMRNIYAGIRRIRADLDGRSREGGVSEEGVRELISDLNLMRARVAYLTGRSKGNRDEEEGMKCFKERFEKLVKAVSTEKDLRAMLTIMESVLAYHRYYSEFGGR